MDRNNIYYDTMNNQGFIPPKEDEKLMNYYEFSDKSEDAIWEGDYFQEDVGSFNDVARSKKFYLKRKEMLDEARCIELEDVFIERTAEEESCESENEEQVLQVVWSEDEAVQNKLVRFIEALDVKKSNSKFTLSMVDDEFRGMEVDSSEGEEIRSRFLEVKDSLEMLATSSRSLRAKFSDCDITTEEDEEVNRIWRKSCSPWTSSLQIEIGKLQSEADQETVLQVLDDGAQGKINVKEVTRCLGNLLDQVEPINDDNYNPSKKVSFVTADENNVTPVTPSSINSTSLMDTSKSFSSSGNSKENLTVDHPKKSSSKKKVSFHTVRSSSRGILNNTVDPELESNKTCVDKQNKKVSFFKLMSRGAGVSDTPEDCKIKKSVSFHDSVEADKEFKEDINYLLKNSFELESPLDTLSETAPIEYMNENIYGGQYDDLNDREEIINCFPENPFDFSDVASGLLAEDSFINALKLYESVTDFSDCCMVSGSSVHSSNLDEGGIIHLPDCEDEIIENSYNDYPLPRIVKDIMIEDREFKHCPHDLEYQDHPENGSGISEFIQLLIKESLYRKLDEINSVVTPQTESKTKEEDTGGLGKKLKVLYNQCRGLIDVDGLSKSMGLSMAAEDKTPPLSSTLNEKLFAFFSHVLDSTQVNKNDEAGVGDGIEKNDCKSNSSSNVKSKNLISLETEKNKNNDLNVPDEEYMSADSDE